MDLETTLLDPPTSDLQRSPNGNITVDVILFVKVSLSLGWTKSIGKNNNLVKSRTPQDMDGTLTLIFAKSS